ncbi:MAG: nicotinate-nucleotide--dimethylbenzimidazole phosphoribosyltransferase [Acidimicrobiales bacterium]
MSTKQAVVERAVRRVGQRDTTGILTGLGGPEVAFLAGVVLGVAAGGGMVVLDGMATTVAAIVATLLEPAGVVDHLVAGQRSNERGHAALLRQLGLEPLLDWRLRAGEGVGATYATRLLLGGLRARQRGTTHSSPSPSKGSDDSVNRR